MTSFSYRTSNYFDESDYSSEITANRKNYLDLVDQDDTMVDEFAISSKVISKPYINVFMELTENIEDNVLNFNKNLKPEKDKRGLTSNIVVFNDMDWSERRNKRMAYLKTLNDVYSVRIDSLNYVSEFILSEGKKGLLGFETFVKLDSLSEGKHMLKVIRKRIQKGDTVKHSLCRIPFWYFK